MLEKKIAEYVDALNALMLKKKKYADELEEVKKKHETTIDTLEKITAHLKTKVQEAYEMDLTVGKKEKYENGIVVGYKKAKPSVMLERDEQDIINDMLKSEILAAYIKAEHRLDKKNILKDKCFLPLSDVGIKINTEDVFYIYSPDTISYL